MATAVFAPIVAARPPDTRGSPKLAFLIGEALF
jgi:hypothetical protein